MNRDRYLERIGIDPTDVGSSDDETLRRLQRAHVTTVPFETLAITGDPFDDTDDGTGISLTLPDLYDKIVERERGGFCFELNGLFGWLLADLGFDADRIAARVVNDGDSRPPANHHTHLVHLDKPYLVDVGLGIPTLRRPLALDGRVEADAAGVAWRVVESDRSNAEYVVQYHETGDDWTDRYFFRTTPRTLSHFEATCEYLATDPESGFTGTPVVARATENGHAKLSVETYTRSVDGETQERTVAEGEWHDVLATEFGLVCRG